MGDTKYEKVENVFENSGGGGVIIGLSYLIELALNPGMLHEGLEERYRHEVFDSVMRPYGLTYMMIKSTAGSYNFGAMTAKQIVNSDWYSEFEAYSRVGVVSYEAYDDQGNLRDNIHDGRPSFVLIADKNSPGAIVACYLAIGRKKSIENESINFLLHLIPLKSSTPGFLGNIEIRAYLEKSGLIGRERVDPTYFSVPSINVYDCDGVFLANTSFSEKVVGGESPNEIIMLHRFLNPSQGRYSSSDEVPTERELRKTDKLF